MDLTEELDKKGWLPLMFIKWVVFFNNPVEDPIVVNTFSTIVYGVRLEINPQVIYDIFRIP